MFWECKDGFKSQILEDDVVALLNEQQYLLNHQNELLDEIFTIFQRYGIDTGYNKRILEIALENLTNGDD